MNIKHLHKQFIHECQDGQTIKRRCNSTIQNYQNAFDLLIKWFPISVVEDLHVGILRQFFRKGEKERCWQCSTVITYRKNLSPFFQWLVVKNYQQSNPLDKIPTPRLIKKMPEIYSEEEIEKIIYKVEMSAKTEFERFRNKAILATLLMTGVRKGELLGFKICDIDFENSCIRINGEFAKNKSPRVVPMTFRLKEILSDYVKYREKLGLNFNSFWVSNITKKKLTEHGLKHLSQKLSKELGFTFKTHKCRHTFATMAYKGSNDILAVKQVLGHKDINTTLIYTQVLPENLKDLMEENEINALF